VLGKGSFEVVPDRTGCTVPAKALKDVGKEFQRWGADIEKALDSKDDDTLGTERKWENWIPCSCSTVS